MKAKASLGVESGDPPSLPANPTRPETRPQASPAISALALQLKASNVFRESFVDSEEDEAKKFELFLRIFMEDAELRRYFEENHDSGEFCCFVCGGIGENGTEESFKSCVGLVQHSSAVGDQSHRALGMVLCKVLAWDFDKIPRVVTKGEPLGRTLGRNAENVVKDDNDGELVENEGSSGKELKQTMTEWPCGEAVVTSSSDIVGWPVITRKLASAVSSISAEEQELLDAHQLHHKAVKVCEEFFRTASVLDCDDSDDSEDREEEEEEEEDDSSEDSENENEDADATTGYEELDFFVKLFTEDAKLREFYIKNCNGWNFCCLVCGGIGKKVWKRFKGCLALVQHSTAIANTRKKRAHRAYGQVICQILGWDTNRFPLIAFDQPLPKLSNSQGEVEDSDSVNAIAA